MKWQKIVNACLKITILLLVMHALIYSDLAQYQEKGMKYRIIGYPLATFMIFIYRSFYKAQRKNYPLKTDILLSSIIALDMLGNTLGFYGKLEWWDDIMHLINSALLAMIVIDFYKDRVANKYLIAHTIGIISWLQVAWEIAEYVTFVTTSSKEMPMAYRDTIGDLLFGQIGIYIATITLMFIKRKVK